MDGLIPAMFDQMPAYQWWGANFCEQEAGELKTVALKVWWQHL